MINATKEMFSKYCDFKGRTSLSSFWWAVLGYFILSFIVGFVGGLILGLLGTEAQNASNIVTSIWSLATLLPVLGMEVRRLHDTNKSGWWIFISFIPIVGSIILLIFFCMPSVNSGNRY